MSELLPCPFCGSDIVGCGRMMNCVFCSNCGTAGPPCSSKALYVAAWNNRAKLPSALPIPAPDPRYDARCALQDKTDWSAS
jgi:hypothetical protein